MVNPGLGHVLNLSRWKTVIEHFTAPAPGGKHGFITLEDIWGTTSKKPFSCGKKRNGKRPQTMWGGKAILHDNCDDDDDDEDVDDI